MSNRYTAKVSESLKLRGWIDEIQAKSLRSECDRKDAEIVRLKAEVDLVNGFREQLRSKFNQKCDTVKEAVSIIDRIQAALHARDKALVEAREALEKWKAYYEAQLDDCDKEITRYTKEQDFHGVNFHQGRRSGIIQHDIGLQPLKNLAATLNSLLGDKCGVATPPPDNQKGGS